MDIAHFTWVSVRNREYIQSWQERAGGSGRTQDQTEIKQMCNIGLSVLNHSYSYNTAHCTHSAKVTSLAALSQWIVNATPVCSLIKDPGLPAAWYVGVTMRQVFSLYSQTLLPCQLADIFLKLRLGFVLEELWCSWCFFHALFVIEHKGQVVLPPKVVDGCSLF